MNSELLKLTLDIGNKLNDRNEPIGAPVSFGTVKKISSKGLAYSEKNRGQWVKPEYDLEELQIAQDTDSYIFRAIQMKVERFMLAGWEMVSLDDECLTYMKERIYEIESLSGIPFPILLKQTAQDLIRYSNCMWVKVRNSDASSGKPRPSSSGSTLEPVAGYFILPFETLQFKLKANGEIKKIMQKMPGTGIKKEYSPQDVIHFYTNRKPGFAMGTPELTPVIADAELLRNLEENIEELIHSALYPVWHWKVGNDNLPERVDPYGNKETDIVKKTIEYMPAGGIFVTDHRHEIKAQGSEGRALRAEGYLQYFKQRLFSGLGVSGVDMGEGDSANKATAQVLSNTAIQHIEALQLTIKIFLERFVINELLLEKNANHPLHDPEYKVEIKFGSIDKEAKTKLENQTIQLFSNKLITESEARKKLGERPMREDDRQLTYFKLYEEPLAMLKSIAQPAATEALVENNNSGISRTGATKQEQLAKQSNERGRPASPSSSGQQSLSKSKSRPSNQYGTRSSPKFTKDANFVVDLTILDKSFNDGLEFSNSSVIIDSENEKLYSLKEDFLNRINLFNKYATARIKELQDENLDDGVILKSLKWRYNNILDEYTCKSYELGVKLGELEIKQ